MPEVCLSCCLLAVGLIMFGEDCLLHFPWWKIHLGNVVYPGIVPDIAQKEGSGGPRPVASQSHCAGGQYLTSYVSL